MRSKHKNNQTPHKPRRKPQGTLYHFYIKVTSCITRMEDNRKLNC